MAASALTSSFYIISVTKLAGFETILLVVSSGASVTAFAGLLNILSALSYKCFKVEGSTSPNLAAYPATLFSVSESKTEFTFP